MGFAKGKARFPFALFWFLLQEQKKRRGGEPYKLSHIKGFATPIGEKKLSQTPEAVPEKTNMRR